MEVNKSEAERCRDMGATALRNGQTARAVKLLKKSLSLYPLPGVQALQGQAEKKLESEINANNSTNSSTANNNSRSSSMNGSASIPQRSTSNVSSSSATSAEASPSGRPYTNEQVRMISEVLKSKEGGQGAHYRVLGVPKNANEAMLKKAYRKMALKLHPDKNAAPQSDEAFKAVGLAYATLNDSQKRAIYDRYGDEDPDNRGGGNRQAGVHFNGQEVNPEDVFNMFFGGGVPGGFQRGGMPAGFRAYSTGFGGGIPRRQQQQQRGAPQQQENPNVLAQLLQLLPLFVLFFLSFFNFGEQATSTHTGNSNYFSLTHSPTFTNPLHTKLTRVKEIPYFVTDKFMRTYHRDRYQLAQVERMVENSYNKYLVEECKNQENYKIQLVKQAKERNGMTQADKERQLKKAEEFDLTRCSELEQLFPRQKTGSTGYGQR